MKLLKIGFFCKLLKITTIYSFYFSYNEMGITYYYCIECESCYLDEYCNFDIHHYICTYKSENPTLPFIEFLKEHNLLKEFLKTLPTFGFDDGFECSYIYEGYYYEFMAVEEKYKSHKTKDINCDTIK